MLPNFLIAGVSRSGTTSLYHYLNQHQDISFPNLKEPRYFSSIKLQLPQKGPGDQSVDEKLIKTFKEYCELYTNINNHLVGDASSEYFYNYKVAIPEIKSRLGDVPIIIMLRNPIDRAFSAYLNLVRDGREALTFEQALTEEPQRIKDGFDEMWHYTRVSLYADAAQAFKMNFSKIKFILFDDFASRPDQVTREVFSFLGVSSDYKIDTNLSYSKGGEPKSKLITLLFGRKYRVSTYLRRAAFGLLGRRNLEKLLPLFISSPEKIQEETYNRLKVYFSEDLKKLRSITSLDTSIWM